MRAILIKRVFAACAFVTPGVLNAAAVERYTPDLSGFWILDRGTSIGIPKPATRGENVLDAKNYPPVTGDEPAPVRPELIASMRARRKYNDDHGLLEERTLKCLPPNGFDAVTWPEPIDVVQRDDQIAIIPERERSLVRRIYVGGKHPEPLITSVTGHSVAFWQGDSLVVDTVGLDPSVPFFAASYLPHSADLRVRETIRLGPGGKTLVMKWLVTDPAVLTKPWTILVTFNRAPASTEHFEAVCDVNYRGLGPKK